MGHYITNGELIAAAIIAGYPYHGKAADRPTPCSE